MKQQIITSDAPSAPAFLSQAIVTNGIIFVSGQIHSEVDNSLVGVCAKALPLGASIEISVIASK